MEAQNTFSEGNFVSIQHKFNEFAAGQRVTDLTVSPSSLNTEGCTCLHNLRHVTRIADHMLCK